MDFVLGGKFSTVYCENECYWRPESGHYVLVFKLLYYSYEKSADYIVRQSHLH